MTKLPADFVENVAAVIGRWWDRASQVATSTYARGAMKANLLGNLRRGDLSTVPRVYIERMARAGHEPAQEALRLYIAEAVDSHAFQDLPGGFQTFARDFLLNGMPDCERLPGYGRGNKIIDTWTRDVMINFFMTAAMERWKFKKNRPPPSWPSCSSRAASGWLRPAKCWTSTTAATPWGVGWRNSCWPRYLTTRRSRLGRRHEWRVAPSCEKTGAV